MRRAVIYGLAGVGMAGALVVALLVDNAKAEELRRKQEQWRRDELADLNAKARDTVGRDVFRLDGERSEHLVLAHPDCNLGVLYELLQRPGFKLRLMSADFSSVRCEGGIKVTAPWTDE